MSAAVVYVLQSYSFSIFNRPKKSSSLLSLLTQKMKIKTYLICFLLSCLFLQGLSFENFAAFGRSPWLGTPSSWSTRLPRRTGGGVSVSSGIYQVVLEPSILIRSFYLSCSPHHLLLFYRIVLQCFPLLFFSLFLFAYRADFLKLRMNKIYDDVNKPNQSKVFSAFIMR